MNGLIFFENKMANDRGTELHALSQKRHVKEA